MCFLLIATICLSSGMSIGMDRISHQSKSIIPMEKIFEGTPLLSTELSERRDFAQSLDLDKCLLFAMLNYPSITEYSNCLSLVQFLSQQIDYPESYATDLVIPVIPSARKIFDVHRPMFEKLATELGDKDIDFTEVDINFHYLEPKGDGLNYLINKGVDEEALLEEEKQMPFLFDKLEQKTSFLMQAAAANKPKLFAQLLQKGANPDKCMKELFLYGSLECLQILAEIPTIKLQEKDNNLLKILFFAIGRDYNQELDKIKILLKLDRDHISCKLLNFFQMYDVSMLEKRAGENPFDMITIRINPDEVMTEDEKVIKLCKYCDWIHANRNKIKLLPQIVRALSDKEKIPYSELAMLYLSPSFSRKIID